MRALMVLGLALAVGCSGATEEPPPGAVTGQITAVGRDDRGVIRTFTVEDDGTDYRVRIDPSRDYGFDLEHLVEHRTQRLPVRVTLEQRGEEIYAIEILDA
ncbi:MAG TPA: hypothetical protein VE737_09690 [Actinomycetota bacterium]|nr:hypothetical protein [Actinomycetota bacterium]